MRSSIDGVWEGMREKLMEGRGTQINIRGQDRQAANYEVRLWKEGTTFDKLTPDRGSFHF